MRTRVRVRLRVFVCVCACECVLSEFRYAFEYYLHVKYNTQYKKHDALWEI